MRSSLGPGSWAPEAVPELPEVEAYRRLAKGAVGLRVTGVDAPDSWYLKGGLDARSLTAALVGRRFIDARRIGKLLLLDTDADGPTLGLRFGMTGRLILDGVPGVETLLYTSNDDRPIWDRFALSLGGADGRTGRLAVRDPRRLGGVELDPDESRLGPDALSADLAGLRRALGSSAAPLKGRLMDQSRLAGVGNLMADEILWRAGLDPARPAGGLDDAELRRLSRALRSTVADLMARGGSHRGDLGPARVHGGRCTRDGALLVRRTVAGRTTWSCPAHQR
jgi:formamidopyrimidine-DNA glycosylase